MNHDKLIPALLLIVVATTTPSIVCGQTSATLSSPDISTDSLTLMPLPALAETLELGAPVKSPSLARNLDLATTDTLTTLSSPNIEQPKIYWGTVGEKGGHTLNSVMQTAWKANPNWSTYAANHAAAHAELVEACALLNPEVEAEFGRETADEGGGSRSIWSLGFSQPLELPGKRQARQAEALAGFPVVQGQMGEYANLLKTDVREAYWTIQYHAALEQMHATQVSLTQKQYDLAKLRQELGDVGRIEVTNARVELLKSTREREAARRRKAGAKAALNALTGGALGTEFRLSQNFSRSYERPPLNNSIQQALLAHPRLATLAAQLEQKYAGIERQNREGWPDVRVGARKSRGFDDESLAVTAAIEIPIFNRNEGGVAKAEAEAKSIYAQVGIAYNELRRDVEVAYQNLMLAQEQIDSYDNGLKEASEEGVNLAWQAFNLGGGGYVDILLARRQLLEIQQGYIQALYDAATARARFDQSVGK